MPLQSRGDQRETRGKNKELFFPQLGHIWEGACRAPGEGGISCITLGEMRVYFGCVQSQAPAWDTTVPPAPEDVLTTEQRFFVPHSTVTLQVLKKKTNIFIVLSHKTSIPKGKSKVACRNHIVKYFFPSSSLQAPLLSFLL